MDYQDGREVGMKIFPSKKQAKGYCEPTERVVRCRVIVEEAS